MTIFWGPEIFFFLIIFEVTCKLDYFFFKGGGGSFLISTIFGGHEAFLVGVYTIKKRTVKM